MMSGTLVRIETYWAHEQDSRSSQHWTRNVLMDKCGLGGRLQKIKQPQGLTSCGQKFGPACQKSTKWKAAPGCRRTEAPQCGKVEWHLLYWSGWWGVRRNHQKNCEKLEIPMEAAMPCLLKTFRHKETCSESNEIQKSKHVHAPYKLMNLRGSVWKGLCRKIMKITLQWTKNGRSSKSCRLDKWPK